MRHSGAAHAQYGSIRGKEGCGGARARGLQAHCGALAWVHELSCLTSSQLPSSGIAFVVSSTWQKRPDPITISGSSPDA